MLQKADDLLGQYIISGDITPEEPYYNMAEVAHDDRRRSCREYRVTLK